MCMVGKNKCPPLCYRPQDLFTTRRNVTVRRVVELKHYTQDSVVGNKARRGSCPRRRRQLHSQRRTAGDGARKTRHTSSTSTSTSLLLISFTDTHTP